MDTLTSCRVGSVPMSTAAAPAAARYTVSGQWAVAFAYMHLSSSRMDTGISITMQMNSR